MTIQYSVFPSSTIVQPQLKSCQTWADFVADLAAMAKQPRPATSQHKTRHTPAISPATYRPGVTRANGNVVGWGGWIAVDVDNKASILSIETALNMLDGVNHVLYTSTSCSTAREAFRLCVQLDAPVPVERIPALWCGVWHLFSRTIDQQCRDPSRIYYAPAAWQASAENPAPIVRFSSCTNGAVLTADSIIGCIPAGTDIPTLAPVATPVAMLPGTVAAIETLITQPMLDRYNALPVGEHYRGLYAFMVAVAGEAVSRGVAITDADLAHAARIADAQCHTKTSASRWARIHHEASRALGFAAANPRQTPSHTNLSGFFGY